jgi:hypothetical protein
MCRPARQGNTAQDKTTQENARPGKTRHFQDKTDTTQGNTRQDNGIQSLPISTALSSSPSKRLMIALREMLTIQRCRQEKHSIDNTKMQLIM